MHHDQLTNLNLSLCIGNKCYTLTIAAWLQDHIDIRTAKKKAFHPLSQEEGPPTPTAPSVMDMLRSGSVLQQILSDHKKAKWMPEEHQRTIMDQMSAEEKVRDYRTERYNHSETRWLTHSLTHSLSLADSFT